MLSQDFLDLLRLLQQLGVRYLLVGGHAVSIYATPRYTKDLDLWLERFRKNAPKVLAALQMFGFGSLALTEEDFITPEFVVQLGWSRSESICWNRRLDIELAGINDLIENKERAGRLRDLADAEDLKQRKGADGQA